MRIRSTRTCLYDDIVVVSLRLREVSEDLEKSRYRHRGVKISLNDRIFVLNTTRGEQEDGIITVFFNKYN